MKAVNLVPADNRKGLSGGRPGAKATVSGVGPAQFVVALLVIVVGLILLRVLADNGVNNKKATLAAVEGQVATEQTEASKLSVYVTFVKAAAAREQQVREIAEQRFAWKRTFDQFTHVLPPTTSLTTLSADTGAATAATATPAVTGETSSGPTFTLAGCAATPNQNGVATLLRRLNALTGVTNVSFQGNTHSAGCNNFSVMLDFAAPDGSVAVTPGATSPTASPTTTTTTTETTG